jgi:hypothetical protein
MKRGNRKITYSKITTETTNSSKIATRTTTSERRRKKKKTEGKLNKQTWPLVL